MRQLPHFPPEIPDEPLVLRRIYVPPHSPRKDEVVKSDWCGTAMTIAAAADPMLRAELTRSGAHAVRLETEDGGFIRGKVDLTRKA